MRPLLTRYCAKKKVLKSLKKISRFYRGCVRDGCGGGGGSGGSGGKE